MLVEQPASRPILTRGVVLLLIASAGGMGSFYLLLPVVPLYAAGSGAGLAGAGLCTGAMMLATVLLEPAVPGLLRRLGNQAVMAAGLALLGAPAIALIWSSWLPLVLAMSVLRGAGLAIVVVTGIAVLAEAVPDERRSEAMGIYGLAVGVPSIVFLPLGLWAIEPVGYAGVFIAGAALALLCVFALPGLPPAIDHPDRPGRVLSGWRRDRLLSLVVVFALFTLGAGAIATFLPLAVPAGSRSVAALALLAQSCTAMIARWATGRYGDRLGAHRILVPAIVAAAAGTAGLVWVDIPLVVVVGMAIFGLGFGAAQNATLTLMLKRVRPSEFGRVSALWNLAYDSGIGAGAVSFGLLAGPLGYPTAFALAGLVLLAGLIPACLDGALSRRETASDLGKIGPAG